MTGRPNPLAYSIARRYRLLFITGFPSSESATTPASFNSPISARVSPFSSLVTAPTGKTWVQARSRAWRKMYSVTARVSLTGLVLAMQARAVYPPAAPAIDPVSMVSLYSNPGSRRWQCMSKRPGTRTFAVQSMTSPAGWEDSLSPLLDRPARALDSGIPGPISLIFPSLISTSIGRSVPLAGSITRAFLNRMFIENSCSANTEFTAENAENAEDINE